MAKQKVVIVGAGPVGSLAAIFAAKRGYDVELYELRSGEFILRLHGFPAAQLGVSGQAVVAQTREAKL
jgi:2-polyprenyl-6-methoxyphenol hydroxylase-like FAD-dependent oxidoreductase